jgi:hypothetical protein
MIIALNRTVFTYTYYPKRRPKALNALAFPLVLLIRDGVPLDDDICFFRQLDLQ